MKIALVHDYLREYGGAERVLEELHVLYPNAPVYVAFFDQIALGIHAKKFANWDIRQSWMTKIPYYKKIYSPLRIFAPQFFSSFDMSKYDVIISSSNMYFAKAVKKSKTGIHISYCHTPPRALYGYTTQTNWKKNPIIRVAGTLINHYLRVVDYQVSQKVDFFICNSREVQKRIKKFYRRDATVIYPPVNIADMDLRSRSLQFGGQVGMTNESKYYLFVGRLAFAKHPEIAVLAANKLKIPLKVAGTGGMFEQLENIKGKTVELLGAVSDEKLSEIYQGAKALIFPVEDEDFGIVPVEAMGHGIPVIAHNSGGPRETVVDLQKNKEQRINPSTLKLRRTGKKDLVSTGVLFNDLSVGGLVDAINRFEKTKFDPQKIHQYSLKFNSLRFRKEIKTFVDKVMV